MTLCFGGKQLLLEGVVTDQQTVFQKVLIPVLKPSLSLKGHEEESQETRIEMWVPAWPAWGGIKCPETEMTLLCAGWAVVHRNGQAALDSNPTQLWTQVSALSLSAE